MNTWAEQLAEFRNALNEAHEAISDAHIAMTAVNESLDLLARLVRRYEKEVKDEA